MVDLGNIITSFFGTTFEFFGFVTNTMAKVIFSSPSQLIAILTYLLPPPISPLHFPNLQFHLADAVEEINETHVTAWTQMITQADPPVSHTTFTAYMDMYHLKKHTIAFNADKIKNVVGYKLRRPNINHETLKELIDKLKAEGSWPNI